MQLCKYFPKRASLLNWHPDIYFCEVLEKLKIDSCVFGWGFPAAIWWCQEYQHWVCNRSFMVNIYPFYAVTAVVTNESVTSTLFGRQFFLPTYSSKWIIHKNWKLNQFLNSKSSYISKRKLREICNVANLKLVLMESWRSRPRG